MAVASRVWHHSLRCEIHELQKRRTAWCWLQPHHEDGHQHWRSPENLEVQHDESLERQLGKQAHDGAVRGGEYYVQLFISRL